MWQHEFQATLHNFRSAQLLDPPEADIPSLLDLKRHSTLFPLRFALIEYASDLHIPETARTSSKLRNLAGHALDVLIWMDVRDSERHDTYR